VRKKEEPKDRDKPPSEWGVGRRYNFAGYEKGYPFLIFRLIRVTQKTGSKKYTIGLTSG
jgi:hypothetical protein